MKKVSEMVPRFMLFCLISGADVKIEKHRLDCAGCSGSRVGSSRILSKIKKIASDIRTLSAHSLFRRRMWKRVSQRHAFDALWGSFHCSGDPLGSPKTGKVVTKGDKMRAWNQPCCLGTQRGQNATDGCPRPLKWSLRGPKMEPKS